MRYVAAYMLATLGGNANPSQKDLENILGSVGIEVEKDKAAKVISELKGKDINQVIAEGEKKLASVPSGGGGAAAPAAAAGGGGGAAPAAKKKEEKKDEPEEESDDDLGFGLFD
uniref:Large ribosomal subunit protein P2 n=1 Tax=Lepidochitona cinerea TaxID=256056 RepID=E3P7G1_LEPCI|nr:ribosomal protein P2 [Lepidochitona cinerea]